MTGDGTVPLPAGKLRVRLADAAPALNVRPLPTFELLEEDDWVEGYRSDCGPSARRRLRGTCTATLDLHGHDVRSARAALLSFLAAERGRRRALVLVIVGKGKHSPGGRAILRQELATWLSRAPAAQHVLAFRTAPAALGGSGGVTVLLAPPT
jgi:DNA-nicking Smr family endonuclease